MRVRYAFLGIAVLGIVLAVFFQTDRAALPWPGEASPGTDGGGMSRLEWEHLRLRDPVTDRVPENIRRRELRFAARRLSAKASGGAGDWAFRGPDNVGGRTRAVAVDVTDSDVILAGGVSGGMWRSTDAGANWIRTTPVAAATHSVTSVAQDIRSGNTLTWYFGTGELAGNSFGVPGDGIYKSTDGGQTWSVLAATVSGTPQATGDDFDYVHRILTRHSNAAADEVLAATRMGIFRSLDGGTGWTKVLGAAGPVYFTEIGITPSGGLVATVSHTIPGVYTSADGTTWDNITPSGWPASSGRAVIGVADDSLFYTLVYNGSTPGHELWKAELTPAAGWVWSKRVMPDIAPLSQFAYSNYNMTVAATPGSPDTVFVGGILLYRSTDGGATTGNWSTMQGIHVDMHEVVFDPMDRSTIYVGSDGGLYRSSDAGGTWSVLEHDYITSQFYSVCLERDSQAGDIVMGGMQDNGTSGSYLLPAVSDSWEGVDGADGGPCAIASSRSAYYTSWQRGRTHAWSLDAQLDPTGPRKRIDPAGAGPYPWMNPFILDPSANARMFFAGGNAVWRADDLTALPDDPDVAPASGWAELTTTQTSGTVSALGAGYWYGNPLYFGTSEGKIYRVDDPRQSSTPVVTEITPAGMVANAWVSSIAVDPRNNGRALLVAVSNYNVPSIFYSDDRGASWTDVSGTLEENPDGLGAGPSVRSVAVVPGQNGTVYLAGTSAGLYSTASLSGTSTVWAAEAPGLIGTLIVEEVASRYVSRAGACAATHGGGVYCGDFGGINPYFATVSVTAPNGGEVIEKGSTVSVEWAQSTAISSVSIRLYRGATLESFLGSVTDGSTSFEWAVPESLTPAADYRIAITGFSDLNTSLDFGDGFFEVIEGQLPVVLRTFVAFADGDDIVLRWETASGSDEVGFGVEQEVEGEFTEIGYVEASDWARERRSYEFRVSAPPPGRYAFRLRHVDEAGQAEFSESVEVDVGLETALYVSEVYPNPVGSSGSVEIFVRESGPIRVNLYDLTGRLVRRLSDNAFEAGQLRTLRIDGGRLASGTYVLRVEGPSVSASRVFTVSR
jgi:hypothetical protein